MSDSVRAKGVAKHKSGEYSAALVLKFETPANAFSAMGALGRGWARGVKHHDCLAWLGTPEEFEECKKILISFGADPSKLEVLKRPGEEFSIAIPSFPKSWSGVF